MTLDLAEVGVIADQLQVTAGAIAFAGVPGILGRQRPHRLDDDTLIFLAVDVVDMPWNQTRLSPV